MEEVNPFDDLLIKLKRPIVKNFETMKRAQECFKESLNMDVSINETVELIPKIIMSEIQKFKFRTKIQDYILKISKEIHAEN